MQVAEDSKPKAGASRPVSPMPLFEYLLTLVVLHDKGNFKATARELGVTVPCVSQRLAKLEAALGIELIDRPGKYRNSVLTPQGRALSSFLSQWLPQLSEAIAQVAAMAPEVQEPPPGNEPDADPGPGPMLGGRRQTQRRIRGLLAKRARFRGATVDPEPGAAES